MSIVRICSVFCDGTDATTGEPCPQWVAETDEGAVVARMVARRHGWRRRDGRDLCPDCVAEPE